MNDLPLTTYACASCGELNETLVDPSGGARQRYTEDCQICCRPNLLTVTLTPEGEIDVQAEFEE
jgi:hypothetical protein